MAPAASEYFSASTSPNGSTKANTRSLLYLRFASKSAGATFPNDSATRFAKPRA
jgi:hypothetical protein